MINRSSDTHDGGAQDTDRVAGGGFRISFGGAKRIDSRIEA